MLAEVVVVKPDFTVPNEYMKDDPKKPCKRHTHRSRSKFSPPNLCIPKCPKHYRYDYNQKHCVVIGTRSPKKKSSSSRKPQKSKQINRKWVKIPAGGRGYKLTGKRCSPNTHRSPLDPRYCIRGHSKGYRKRSKIIIDPNTAIIP